MRLRGPEAGTWRRWSAAIAAGSMSFLAVVALAILAILLGSAQHATCTSGARSGDAGATAPVAPAASVIPRRLLPIYRHAARRYRLGPEGWAYLAAINRIETDFGRNLSTSSAGAIGWMQFLPATWAIYGVDADHDRRRDPNDPDDAIHAAARYLRASGAPRDWHHAIYAYNHAEWYVADVRNHARSYAGRGSSLPSDVPLADPPRPTGGRELRGAASTFGNDPVTGYTDTVDNNTPAARSHGYPNATNDGPGISLLDLTTIGGWWWLRAPNHRTAILQQIDYGPSARGVLVDINAVAARAVFRYRQGDAFPTRQGTWTLIYMGKRMPPGATPNTATDPAPPAIDCSPANACPPSLGPPPPAGSGPIDRRGRPGFTPTPGSDFRFGREPEIARRLDALGRALHLTIYGLSGHRTPAHSIAVGGFANDPHTSGEAADVAVNSRLRASAARLTEAVLRRFGLTRPFAGAHEINHVQLLGTSSISLPAGRSTTDASCSAPGGATLARAITLTRPRDYARLPDWAVAPGHGPVRCDARIVPDLLWLIRAFHLLAHDCLAAGHHTHGTGISIDLVPASDPNPQVGRLAHVADWRRGPEAAARALGWKPACAAHGCIGSGLVPAIHAIFYNGYPDHGDPARFTGACGCPHVHISWQASTYSAPTIEAPSRWVRVFPVGPAAESPSGATS